MQTFQDIRNILNFVLPIVALIPAPLIPQDVKNKVAEVQTKLNAIPTIEDLMKSQTELTAVRAQYQKVSADFFAVQQQVTQLTAQL
jgi:hypothetical protein